MDTCTTSLENHGEDTAKTRRQHEGNTAANVMNLMNGLFWNRRNAAKVRERFPEMGDGMKRLG
jgi:hypothetical protein